MAAMTGHLTGAADPQCLFCKIVAGTIPSYKVYEDDVVFAFLDIGPIVRGHLLVISKGHYGSVLTTPADVAGAVNSRLPKLAQALLRVTGTASCHIVTNAGREAGQTVDHLHYHILPRYEGDGYKMGWPSGKLGEEGAALAGKLAKEMGG